MFGHEDDLVRLVIGLGLGMALLSTVITWAVARRHGRRRALVVPVLALVAVAVLVFRSSVLVADEAMRAAAYAMVFAGPAVAGGMLGLVLSVWPRRRTGSFPDGPAGPRSGLEQPPRSTASSRRKDPSEE